MRVFSSARHLAAVCLAILALYIQIVAAVACLTAPSQAAYAGPSGTLFPICHAADSDTNPAPGKDHAPATQYACPLCALHCQAALASLDPGLVFEPLFRLSTEATHAPFLTHSVTRFAVGAPPRGPPASA